VQRVERRIGGLRTAFLDAGTGDTIVALHGIPTSSLLFAPLIPYLKGHRLVAPDLLGQGLTEVPSRGRLDFAAYFAHLYAFLAEAPPASFHLLLHDFGAVLGLTWAMSHPHRVKSLVVLSTTTTVSVRVVALYAANLVGGRRMLRLALPAALERREHRPEAAVLDEWAGPWTRRRLLRGSDHFGRYHLRRLRGRLSVIGSPTLVLWGENDHLFPVARGLDLARRLPTAEFATVPRCGHWSPLDAPEEIAGHVLTTCQRPRRT
jgi:pimeloyl-ACP methyl ester carboxylesterase